MQKKELWKVEVISKARGLIETKAFSIKGLMHSRPFFIILHHYVQSAPDFSPLLYLPPEFFMVWPNVIIFSSTVPLINPNYSTRRLSELLFLFWGVLITPAAPLINHFYPGKFGRDVSQMKKCNTRLITQIHPFSRSLICQFSASFFPLILFPLPSCWMCDRPLPALKEIRKCDFWSAWLLRGIPFSL